jgi:hypothetical protein
MKLCKEFDYAETLLRAVRGAEAVRRSGILGTGLPAKKRTKAYAQRTVITGSIGKRYRTSVCVK